MKTHDDLCKSASALREMIASEGIDDAVIALGTVVGELKDVSRSYKEAKMTLDVGKIVLQRPQCG